MRLLKIFAALALLVLLAGFLRSLHPLYSEETVVFDEALLGVWLVPGEEFNGSWTFRRSAEPLSYELVVAHEGVAETYKTRLVALGEHRFLDLRPIPPETLTEPYIFVLLPTHAFLKVWIEGDVLHFSKLDHNWLKKKIERKEISIAHEIIDGLIVLTASTKDLQKLVVTYAEDKKAFPEPTRLRRRE